MKIKTFFENHKINIQDKTLVIATSGGPDSMALTEMLLELSQQANFELILAHFDHLLRPDSYLETSLLKEYSEKNNLRLEIGVWRQEDHPEHGIEAAARNARYQFLDQVVRKYQASFLLTAHHGDDLIENILLKFIRSGNPEEMNSMKAVGQMNSTVLLRPLLTYSKDDLLNYAKEHNLAFIQDSTNFEDETIRNRLRHHVIPILKNENPNLINNALRYSFEEERLASFANNVFKQIGEPKLFLGKCLQIDEQKLADLTNAQQKAYWEHFIWKYAHVRSGENLAGYTIKRYQGEVYLWKQADISLPLQRLKEISLDQLFTFYDRQFILTKNKLEQKLVGQFKSNQSKFYAGSTPAGCRLLLKNSHHAKAKKMFALARIPSELRRFCLTIFDQDEQPVFVEKTYTNQLRSEKENVYYIYNMGKL